MSPRQLTDQQLRVVLYRIAQTYLEVERGLRPAAHLASFLTHYEYHRHRTNAAARLPLGGAVLPGDIGRIHLDRQVPAQITAAVLVRQPGDRWGALVVHLRDTSQGWKVDQLERLKQTRHVHRRLDVEPPQPENLGARIQRVEEERRAVEAARRATATRLDDLSAAPSHAPSRSDGPRELRQLLDTWERRLTELDHELDTLDRTCQLRQRLATLDSHQGQENSPKARVTDPILKTLGPRPNHPDWGRIWDQTADELRRYRQRWNITDSELPLGAPTDEPEQARHRQLLAQLLPTVAPWLEHRRQRERGMDQASRDVGHTEVLKGLSVEL